MLSGRGCSRYVKPLCRRSVRQSRKHYSSLPSSEPTTKFSSCILSGIQPTGVPHLGNYLGALANWVQLQKDPANVVATPRNVLYSIVDLHALTVPQDSAALRRNVRDMAGFLLACGIDPAKSILFRQSRVPQHAELAWLFFCRTPIGWLSRMHQWKSKLQMLQQKAGVNSKTTTANLTLSLAAQAEAAEFGGDQPDDATHGLNVGLLAYPVLQAADILIYRATEVPIGEDQIQHLELTNMIARSFNSTYGKEVFPIAKGIYGSTESKRIMSLRVPTSKMSKSDPSDASRINMDDPPDVIRSKIRKATVDSTRGITYDPIERPGVANLINIYSSCTGEPVEEVAQRFAGSGNKEFKDAVADAVIDGLKPIQSEYGRIRKDPQFVEQALEAGEARACSLGSKTLNDVQRAMGLR